MNLPNILTLSRFIFTAAFIVLIQQPGFLCKALAVGMFVLGAFSDFFDGYLARKYQLITNFGKIMDPIADKFLTLSAFFMFAVLGIVSWWMVILIAAREIIVTVYRLYAMKKGRVLAAEKSGKCKTVLQMGTIGVILILILMLEGNGPLQWPESVFFYYGLFAAALMWATLLVTLYSGWSFFINNRVNA